jgi:uncharacterized protein (TIGR02996 family)
MTHDEAFLQAIIENPNDDTLRLIYADWLEERGDPRGAFLRLYAALRSAAPDHVDRVPAEHELGRLREGIDPGWLAAVAPELITRATFHRVLDAPWSGLPPLRLGAVPPGLGTPDRYVLVEPDAGPPLRLDLYAGPAECHAFEEALVWGGLLAVGFGHRVHLVRLEDRSACSLDLGGYFGHLYAGEGYLLAASAERLVRIRADGALLWSSGPLGLDGVVVNSVEGGVVEGEGEWDPPGGWRPFRLRLDTGERC